MKRNRPLFRSTSIAVIAGIVVCMALDGAAQPLPSKEPGFRLQLGIRTLPATDPLCWPCFGLEFQTPVGRPSFEPPSVGRLAPSTYQLRIPPDRFNPLALPIIPPYNFPAGAPDSTLERAAQFRNFLRTIRGDDVICRAIGSLLEIPLSHAGCPGRIVDENKKLSYQVVPTDNASKIYEIELYGRSSELSLQNPNWVERHRFYVALGFDAELEPRVTVFNFEPMFRTTPEFSPENDHLFNYIKRDKDSLLRVFQERIKGAISSVVQDAFARQLAEAK